MRKHDGDGEVDGPLDGVPEGTDDGETDGELDGADDGWSDGALDGELDGERSRRVLEGASTMRAAALLIIWSASVRGSHATSRQRARAAPSHGARVTADSAAFTVRRWRAASSSTFVR